MSHATVVKVNYGVGIRSPPGDSGYWVEIRSPLGDSGRHSLVAEQCVVAVAFA
jgi:hypothetical protein